MARAAPLRAEPSRPRAAGPSPEPVREAATVRNAMPAGQTSLVGVFGDEATRQALIREPSGVIRRVRPGDRVDNWTIAAIGQDSIQLRNGSERRTMRVPGR